MAAVYIDTSALAKWYLNESCSAEFADWIQSQEEACISSLTSLELRCLLVRRRRNRELTVELEQQVFSSFQLDFQNHHLLSYPVVDKHISGAIHLLDTLNNSALRTLDAIHLNIALDLAVEKLATADRVMTETGVQLGLAVERFY